MRSKVQTVAILGVSRGFATQRRARRAFQKFKLAMTEHLQRDQTAFSRLLQFDFNIDARWQIQLHECIDGFIGRINNIH